MGEQEFGAAEYAYSLSEWIRLATSDRAKVARGVLSYICVKEIKCDSNGSKVWFQSMDSNGVEENSMEEFLSGCFKGCKYEYGKFSLGVHPDILMITYSQVEMAGACRENNRRS
ncbi:hypothetical protein LR48_Vigan07g091600 [Vigna angularis]|uniref:Uncharacterized protein n=1 Tax=Phaseolus angularis TaxID=3914 RepID=A0A0L9UXA8_PHAAN|nr:hypothetical protein LR48_Vigan07g091600 [Vigna angularis]